MRNMVIRCTILSFFVLLMITLLSTRYFYYVLSCYVYKNMRNGSIALALILESIREKDVSPSDRYQNRWELLKISSYLNISFAKIISHFSQDMCVVCGSFGQGPEGRLLACSQCGQCYHPYCVNLKLTKVVLRKGWRCLDCTVSYNCCLLMLRFYLSC